MSANLWGDIPKAENLRTPLFLLREQADVLTKATEGVLIGAVSTTAREGGKLDHYLSIVAPALNRYSYTVISVSHGVMIYPATVTDLSKPKSYVVNDEAGLSVIMQSILSSEQTHKVVAGLLAQSRDTSAPNPV